MPARHGRGRPLSTPCHFSCLGQTLLTCQRDFMTKTTVNVGHFKGHGATWTEGLVCRNGAVRETRATM